MGRGGRRWTTAVARKGSTGKTNNLNKAQWRWRRVTRRRKSCFVRSHRGSPSSVRENPNSCARFMGNGVLPCEPRFPARA